MVQEGNILLDSHGDGVIHKMDFPVGNRQHGQLVQIDRANEPIPISPPALAPTYRASFSIAAVSGDSVVIFSRDDKVIKVTEIAIAKPSVTETVLITKRSTYDTGGTSTLATIGASDSNDEQTTTVVRLYTAAPTLGTAIATIARCVVNTTDLLVFDFTLPGRKPPTLRNTAECLAINVDATGTLPGCIEWTEEAL